MKIIAAPMNGLSTWSFANSCEEAGFWPSVSLFMYRPELFDALVKKVPDYTIFSGNNWNLPRLSAEVRWVELQISHNNPSEVIDLIKNLQSNGTKVILKQFRQQWLYAIEHVDVVLLKSTEGGGAVDGWMTIETQSRIMKSIGKPFFISGGIATAQDVNRCLDLGAETVAIGTPLAVSEEAPMATEAKVKLMNSATITDYHTTHRGVIISEADDKDWNHTESLYEGIRSGESGHIYCGDAIKTIREILPLREIHRRLTAP